MKPKGRPPTTSLGRLDELLHYIGAGTEYTDTDKQFAAFLGISERQVQRLIALGQRRGVLGVRRFRVPLGQGWFNVRTIWMTVPLPDQFGDWEATVLPAAAPAQVEEVASTPSDPLAQQPPSPEVQAADLAPVAEPVEAEDIFGPPSFEEEADIEEEPAAPVAVAPVAEQPTTSQQIPLKPNVPGIIRAAVKDLRWIGQHTAKREYWIGWQDIHALVREVAAGSPITNDILNKTVWTLAERAVDACPPREDDYYLATRYILPELGNTHGDNAEKVHGQIMAATNREQALAALDAVPKDRDYITRGMLAAHAIIRRVLPNWNPTVFEESSA